MPSGEPTREPDWLAAGAIREATALLTQQCHSAAVRGGWWTDLANGGDLRSKPGEKPRRNVPEMLCLVHSEISEALEGVRKNLQDDKLPHRPAVEVELADALIRIYDLAGGLGLDLAGAMAEKMVYNVTRADHQPDARRAAGGKSF